MDLIVISGNLSYSSLYSI